MGSADVLDLLHALTEADAAATGPAAWSPWKGGLVAELVQRTRGGQLPLAVDLTGVTHLASAGVAVLHQVAERHRRQGADLRLHAAAGSTAQQVLTLVALPHQVDQVGARTAPELGRTS